MHVVSMVIEGEGGVGLKGTTNVSGHFLEKTNAFKVKADRIYVS